MPKNPILRFFNVLLCCLILCCMEARTGKISQHHSEADHRKEIESKMGSSRIRYKNNNAPVIQLPGFEDCNENECNYVCGSTELLKSFCDLKNPKLCMCSPDNFMSTNVEGVINPVNRGDPLDRNCSLACNNRNSYPRVWHMNDHTKSCICLLNQITATGITLCDEYALTDLCKAFCRSKSATCAFNGVCLCRDGWPDFFRLEPRFVRKEIKSDAQECSKRCKEYHTEYLPRIYDTKKDAASVHEYEFMEKYCMCGEEIEPEDVSIRKNLHSQGFQECTGLKCKEFCGMHMEAKCEPKYRRACFCQRNFIFFGPHLWSRIPGRKETICVESCARAGLAPRVIEWNPFYEPANDKSLAVYRTSRFPYLYDGKFCHCIGQEGDMELTRFGPCTNELCRWICGHSEAVCDPKTRRACFCNHHQMVARLGRRPDPGETNCNLVCRSNLQDARILEVNWDIPAPEWSAPHAKYCGCIQPVTLSGLTHCEALSGLDVCPRACNNTASFCTKEKVCECKDSNVIKSPMVRLPNGKEAVECGEICRSWTWPLAEDEDRKPYIFDESREFCSKNNSCPEVDTTPWTLHQPGSMSMSLDAMEERPDAPKKYCLCVKSDKTRNKPGIRVPFNLEPGRLSTSIQCILNYTCIAVSDSLHIVK